eukprot:c27666_g1_i1 orf=3-275(-)
MLNLMAIAILDASQRSQLLNILHTLCGPFNRPQVASNWTCAHHETFPRPWQLATFFFVGALKISWHYGLPVWLFPLPIVQDSLGTRSFGHF